MAQNFFIAISFYHNIVRKNIVCDEGLRIELSLHNLKEIQKPRKQENEKKILLTKVQKMKFNFKALHQFVCVSVCECV